MRARFLPFQLPTWPDGARFAQLRLEFAHEPTAEGMARIAQAVVAHERQLPRWDWRWIGRYAAWRFEILQHAGVDPTTRLLALLQVIDHAWPLAGAVSLDLPPKPPVPDPGPREALETAPPRADFEEALRAAAAMPLGPFFPDVAEMSRRFAKGTLALVPVPPPAPDAAAEHLRWWAWEAGHADRELRGPRCSLLCRASGEIALRKGDEPPVALELPSDGAPLRAVALNPAGTRAIYVTEHGTRLWLLELDGPHEAIAPVWPAEGQRLLDAAWIDDRRWVALTTGEVILAIHSHEGVQVYGRVPVCADRIWTFHARVALAAGRDRCELLALDTHNDQITHLATLPVEAAVAVIRDGRLVVAGDGGAFAVHELEATRERAIEAAFIPIEPGEVAIAPGEPVQRLDERGDRWFTSPLGFAVASRRAPDGEHLFRRCDERPVLTSTDVPIRGPRLAVWPVSTGFYVHDGRTIFRVGRDLALALTDAPRVDGVAELFANHELQLAIARPGELTIGPRPAPRRRVFPSVPLEWLAATINILVVKPVGARPYVLELLDSGELVWAAVWPARHPSPHAVWWIDIVGYAASITADGRPHRYRLPPLYYLRTAHPVTELSQHPPPNLPELSF